MKIRLNSYMIFTFLGFNSLYAIKKHQQPTPFSDKREHPEKKKSIKPEYIIIHFTANCSYKDSWKAFFNFLRPVSTHYLIGIDGKVIQMVDESKRAWHAGDSCWKNNRHMNSYSIGIELINPGFSEINKDPCTTNEKLWNQQTGKQISGSSYLWYEFTPKQVESLITLCKEIIKRHKIPAQNILGHSDIAPGRKVDPGPLFPWKILAEQGIGIWWNDIQSINSYNIADLQKKLQQFGYHITITGKEDAQTTKVVKSFQMHFQQDNISGIADKQTVQILNNLLAQLDQDLTNKAFIL